MSLEAKVGEAIRLYLDDKLTPAAFRAKLDRLVEEDPEGFEALKESYVRSH